MDDCDTLTPVVVGDVVRLWFLVFLHSFHNASVISCCNFLWLICVFCSVHQTFFRTLQLFY